MLTTNPWYAAATEAFAERGNESEKAFRRACIETIRGYMIPSSQYMPDTRAAKIEAIETDIPRWKYGVKLSNKVSRAVFDDLLYHVKQNNGKYNKDSNCWIFSSESKRKAFFDWLAKNNKSIDMIQNTNLDEIADTQDIKFKAGHIVMKTKAEFESTSRLYKIEDGLLKIDETHLEYALDSIIEDYVFSKI